MNLGNLKPAKGATKKRRRLGRGPGSGYGGTSTKGTKGQKSRAGHSRRPWFEGGQMPLQRRVPKRGFTNIHARPVETVNVSDLARLPGGETITAEVLKAAGLIQNPKARLKVLGDGELKQAVRVRAHAFSAGAKEKIEAAGGTAEVIEVKARPKRFKKKNAVAAKK